MMALAYAKLGQRRESYQAMKKAEEVNDRPARDEKYALFEFQDEYYMAAHLSTAFRELGDVDKTLEFAIRCIAGRKVGRMSLMNKVGIARAELRRGNFPEACSVGVESARLVGTLRSSLARGKVREFFNELRAAPRTTLVSETIQEIEEILRGSISRSA